MSSRKREPGFYVSVWAPPGMSPEPVELLDGPWPNRAAAERRSAEIASGRPGVDAAPTVIEIGEDGLTILREKED